MAERRLQLTTYLSNEQIGDWEIVKAHFENVADAVILRELIRGKAIDIGRGATKRQAIERIAETVDTLSDRVERVDDRVIRIEQTQTEQGALLRLLCEKLSVDAQP